jgi:F-type H+-transporting ATPase subunit delta
LISEDDNDALLDRVFEGRAVPLVLNFLKVLANHGRLDCLRAVHQSMVEQNNQLRGRIAVQVATATPLDSSLKDKITERLAAMLGGEPQLELVTRPELIGGIVLQVGDTVYDGSVATQLTRAREQMIRRSIHEIQSGRDRFSNPEGN